jgi:CMP-N-acetylneuraminic acid synthetase
MSARPQQAPESLLAIIPARAGSKRIPGKNTREFFGHPLLAYSIAAALNSRLFARVMVSTDSQEIGEIARWYGAEFLQRPAMLASDTASLEDVAVHALETVRNEGFEPYAICQLMPNCPLRRSLDVREQFETFQSARSKFSISVVPYRSVYPHWALTMNASRQGKWLFGKKFLVDSKKLGQAFCPTGAVWWARTADFLRQRSFYGKAFHLAVMDANRGIDIDTEEDFALADLVVRGLRSRGDQALEPVARVSFFAGATHV